MNRSPTTDPLLDVFAPERLNQAERGPMRLTAPEVATGAETGNLFRTIFEHSNDAIFIVDPDNGRIIDANPKASGMLGYSVEELPGMAISAVLSSEMPELLAFTRRVLADGRGWTEELACLTKHGMQFPAEISASRTTIDGKSCVIAFVRDMRERKGTEQALRRLKREHELILNAAGDGIYGIDNQGRALFTNPAAIELLGWPLDEIIGKPAHDFHHHTKPDGSPYPHEECPIYAAFHDGKVHHCDHEIFWHKNGTGVPVEYTSTPIRDGSEIIGAVVVFRDITQRKLAEATLRRLQDQERLAAVGEFASTIAHEIRSPLWTIAVALEYLDTIGQEEKTQKRLDLAAAEVKRLERLLSELLYFAKPYQLSKRELDLSGLIEDTLASLQSTPSTEARDIRYAPPPSTLSISADEDKLKQVLINLLTNACQATRPSESITINVIEPGAEGVVIIEVVNPGMIATDILDRVTEPFFTTKPHGSGLGLPIVKRILEAHGGGFSIRSDNDLRVVARVSLPTLRSL